MDAVLNVNAEKLKDKLQARIDSIRAQYEADENIKELKGEIAYINSGGVTYPAQLAAWYQAVGEGIAAGTITVGDSGRLGGDVPPKPMKNKANAYHWRGWDLASLEGQLKHYERYLENDLDPLKTAIELLDLAGTTEVQVNAADYQGLLNTGWRYR
jgi:hypothetical protein